GTFGVGGLGAGLNSTSNNRDFAVSWLFRNLPVKNLSVYFSDNVNNVAIPGLGLTTDSSSKGFGASSSGYRVAGFLIGAGYQHSMGDVNSNISGTDGETITGSGSSDVFHVLSSRTLPGQTTLTLSAYRIMTRSSSQGDNSSSDSDE